MMLTDFHAESSGRPFAVALIALRIVVAAFFVVIALKNLAGDEQMAADFARWGYPDWFRRVTAVLQILGALALLVPATCFFGGLLLTGVLLGAVATHLRHDPLVASLSPTVVLVLVAISAWPMRPPLLR